MKLVARWWRGVVQIVNMFTMNPIEPGLQSPSLPVHVESPSLPIQFESLQTSPGDIPGHAPVFLPPNLPENPNKAIKCDYSAMGGKWGDCSTAINRGCWIRNYDGSGEEFNITTNYEKFAPKGVTRPYTLILTDETVYNDGFEMTEAKLFNKQYPGTWIQACWGDTIEVTVINRLRYNGTSIHWHGIRQNGTMDMDGVNGVTQCPIAPGKNFTYSFKAVQYGTSWYHSHYSLQYADGLLGPMTIYGPSSAQYDEARDPILVSDWSHRSAFQDFYVEIGALPPGVDDTPPPKMVNILMNGKGFWNCTAEDSVLGKCMERTPRMYETFFERGKRYLMSIINTSTDTTFVFSIDNHMLTMVGADFVPVHPYSNSSVLVGIGQRYHLIVEASPIGNLPSDDSYWIRMIPATDCSTLPVDIDARRGVLRYNSSNGSAPSTNPPTTKQSHFSIKCSDETYSSLVPVIPWKVGLPVNDQDIGTLHAGLNFPSQDIHGNFSRWAMGEKSLWLNFSNPSIMNFNVDTQDWNPETVVIPAAYNESAWMYVLITSSKMPFGNRERLVIPAAHPIHLHGHDFALIDQSDHPYWPQVSNLKFDNPPRRDVALLPQNGYLIIAFKTDNPGAWIMHCHIAWHASAGLAVQFLERQDDLVKIYDKQKLGPYTQMCADWDEWYNNKTNWYNQDEFQDDSGI